MTLECNCGWNGLARSRARVRCSPKSDRVWPRWTRDCPIETHQTTCRPCWQLAVGSGQLAVGRGDRRSHMPPCDGDAARPLRRDGDAAAPEPPLPNRACRCLAALGHRSALPAQKPSAPRAPETNRRRGKTAAVMPSRCSRTRMLNGPDVRARRQFTGLARSGALHDQAFASRSLALHGAGLDCRSDRRHQPTANARFLFCRHLSGPASLSSGPPR